MRILLVSTYELGHQPLHVASPVAALRARGHDVRTLDVSVEDLDSRLFDWAERVAISVPMHTATRLADQLIGELARSHPQLPIATYGLYARVGSAHVDSRFAGEYEPGLLAWAEGVSSQETTHLGRSEFLQPDRSTLPSVAAYARLEHEGEAILAASVEATHGCRHRCRHCPIPSIYDGRIRVVGRDEVLADIDALVDMGVGHITFGDADFLNAPAHTTRVLEDAHDRHPDLTFDVTVKVEHILDHRDVWAHLTSLNLLFVVSAFESVDDRTLEILDKGHTKEDMIEAIAIIRKAGIHLRPTWLPFLPWTTLSDISAVFEFIADHGLADATDPVQMAIKLLVPQGSLLEGDPAMSPHLDGYDTRALTWKWRFEHPEVEVLQKELEAIAGNASDCGQDAATTLNEMREAVVGATGEELPVFETGTQVPRLSESWFCCAEPTQAQSVSITFGTSG